MRPWTPIYLAMDILGCLLVLFVPVAIVALILVLIVIVHFR